MVIFFCCTLTFQILVVVEAALTEEKPCLSKSPLFALLAPLISFVGSSQPQTESLFWNELSAFACGQLIACHRNLIAETETEKHKQYQKTFFQRLLLLVQGLVFHESVSTKKKALARVTQFSISTTIKQQQTQQSVVELHHKKKQKQSLASSLETLVADLLVLSFSLTSEYEAAQFLGLFKDIASVHIPSTAGPRLLCNSDPIINKIAENLPKREAEESKMFDSEKEDLLTQIAEEYGRDKSEEKNTTDHLKEFMYTRLLRLLLYHQKAEVINLKYTEGVLCSTFSFLTYLPEGDGSQFLSVILRVLSRDMIVCQFVEQLLQRVNQIDACRKAVEGLGISGKIAELACQGSERKLDTPVAKKELVPVWRMLTSVIDYLNQEKGWYLLDDGMP